MKVGKNKVTSKLGHGCSRKAVLLDNGLVCKLPRYEDRDNDVAGPDGVILIDLLNEFKDDKAIIKLNKLKAQNFQVPAPCKGTLVEYLLSLKVKDMPEGDFFAKCVKIKVRKKKSERLIDIKGFYENAYKKEPGRYRSWEDLESFIYDVGDLHNGNIVNGYVVDYAAIGEK